MKTLILALICIVSPGALFAGNGGGTMAAAKLADLLKANPKIVFNMAENDNSIRFSYGQIEQGGWSIKQLSVLKSEIASESALAHALQESKSKNYWTLVKSEKSE